ncbi:MAG: NAD(P)-dependent oxidoreductase [Candidatus Limnocylindrales bacterium]
MAVTLVCGGSGFIGRRVCEAVRLQPGRELVGVGLGPPPEGFEDRWLDLDLLDGDRGVARQLRELTPAAVVNCTGATQGSAFELLRSNALVTARLLEIFERPAAPLRFVQIGSAAEYGPGPSGRAVRETAAARPVNAYGISKLAATGLVVAATESRAVDGVVLRVFNAVGPAMPPSTLVGAALGALRRAQSTHAGVVELGPLDAVRDFVDTRDVAAAAAAACVAEKLTARIINVGSGTAHTAREMVEALAARFGFDGRIEEGGTGSPRSAEVPWQVADVSLATRVLGWRAGYDLNSSVDLIVREAQGQL